MFLNPFDGPRAKLARSRRHFDELAREQAAYSKAHPVEIEIRPLASGETALVLKTDAFPSIEASTIVADILSNFRSALDLAVCEACRVAGATDLRNTYFAFASSEAEWDVAARDRMKKAPSAVTTAVRALQPWAGGNAILYALSKLAVSDKHQLLTPLAGTSGTLEIDGLRFSREDGRRTRFQGQVPRWDRGACEALLGTVGEGSAVEITGPVVLTPQFAFGDVDCVPYQPISPLLNRMGRVCEDAINIIERAASLSP